METTPSEAWREAREQAVREVEDALILNYSTRRWCLHPLVQSGICSEVWSIKHDEPDLPDLFLGLPPEFPFAFPKIYLKDLSKYKVVPHLGADGNVCVFDEATNEMNPRRPADAVLECISRAYQILTVDPFQVDEGEFLTEFNHYLESKGAFLCLLDSFGTPKEVRVTWLDSKTTHYRFLVSPDARTSQTWLTRSKLARAVGHETALFLPLKALGRPPYPTTTRELFERLRKVDRRSFVIWRKYLQRKPRPLSIVTAVHTAHGPLVLAWRHALPNGSVRQEARRRHSVSRKEPRSFKQALLKGGADLKVDFFTGERVDRKRLITRTRGADKGEARGRNLLVIGLGSVGSLISETLVQSSVVEKIILIDPQILALENVPRHLCRYESVGLYKVDGVKDILQQRDPELGVLAVSKTIHSALKDVQNSLPLIDSVVLCTGELMMEAELSSTLSRMLPEGTPIHSVWLRKSASQGYVLRQRSRTPGCLSCFLEGHAPEITGYNLNDEVSVSREPGCAPGFTQYGGSRLHRFIGVAVQAILSAVDRPFVLRWIPADENQVIGDAAEILSIDPREDCLCHS